MFVTILNRFASAPNNSKFQLFLTWDDWNDYDYKTQFGIFFVNEEGIKIDLGGVKIAYYGQTAKETKLKVGDTFDRVDSIYFSLGYFEYYEKLNELDNSIRDKILDALNDIAKHPEIFEKAILEPVTKISLLRSISPTEVVGQLRRMANGGALLTEYNFYFKTKINPLNEEPIKLDFEVLPNSDPPSNINVIVGRNGSGKTTILNKIVNTLLKKDKESEFGEILIGIWDIKKDLFPALVNVSFSAFDSSNSEIEFVELEGGFKYYYLGLKKRAISAEGPIVLKNTNELCEEFFESLNTCKSKLFETRWEKYISNLETDSNFKEEEIISLIREDYSISNAKERFAAYKEKAISTFLNLSSGHKIVLLTITRLVELLEEKTLILIDEPETHLHPPLLSAFIRALSELLIDRNGVAIFATHSPVVLQEVPRSCVWKLIRTGNIVENNRLRIESFGENVGTLTQEIFNLEATASGFHKRLKEVVKMSETYEDALSIFSDQLGSEARSILRSAFYQKEKRNDSNR